MALTVNSAFNEFNSESVNLDPNQAEKARSSRDWLMEQLKCLPDKTEYFPRLYDDKHINWDFSVLM